VSYRPGNTVLKVPYTFWLNYSQAQFSVQSLCVIIRTTIKLQIWNLLYLCNMHQLVLCITENGGNVEDMTGALHGNRKMWYCSSIFFKSSNINLKLSYHGFVKFLYNIHNI